LFLFPLFSLGSSTFNGVSLTNHSLALNPSKDPVHQLQVEPKPYIQWPPIKITQSGGQLQMNEATGGGGPLLAVLYCEFDNTKGPTIIYQTPEG